VWCACSGSIWGRSEAICPPPPQINTNIPCGNKMLAPCKRHSVTWRKPRTVELPPPAKCHRPASIPVCQVHKYLASFPLNFCVINFVRDASPGSPRPPSAWPLYALRKGRRRYLLFRRRLPLRERSPARTDRYRTTPCHGLDRPNVVSPKFCYVTLSIPIVMLSILTVMYVPFCVFCLTVLFCVLSVCGCVLDCSHRDIGALPDCHNWWVSVLFPQF
jgi:hypothetical protein